MILVSGIDGPDRVPFMYFRKYNGVEVVGMCGYGSLFILLAFGLLLFSYGISPAHALLVSDLIYSLQEALRNPPAIVVGSA